MWRRGIGPAALMLLASVLAGVFAVTAGATVAAAAQPAGFAEQVIFSGLNHPTKLVFAPDGRIFVAEKSGVIKVFDSITDPTPDIFADLSTQVHDWEDHGLLGLAVPPDFPTTPYVYVLYTADAPIGGTAPVFHDSCPNNNCVTSGRLSRLQASGNHMVGSEQVLLNDWCEVSETHSIGNVAFGPDGKLWVSGGDGASASVVDWGQVGSPSNPCGDPPGSVGSSMNPPAAEGGALRSQSSQRIDGPAVLGGTVIRIDPNTAAAVSDNPYAGSSDPNKRRIVTYGVRNPFRFTFRPGSNEIWLGDVGWNTWEEIDRNPNPLAATVTNFGWPCYEGAGHQPLYDQADLVQCENLYSAGTAAAPTYTYNHAAQVVPGEVCGSGGSSPTGVAFYPSSGGSYPSAYHGALFWADYSRGCIWAMMPGAGGLPNPGNIITFDGGAANPVDLEIGPAGDLYYVDLSGGTVRRIWYSSSNHAPVAAATGAPLSGHPPLTVNFDAHTSSDPDPGDILNYAWDFTSDGTTDATGVTTSHTYSTAGTYVARLTVTDSQLEASTTTLTISVDNDAPVPVIDTPAASFHYVTGATISFSGHATDPQDGTEPASRLQWQAVLHHCATPTSCHEHFVQSWTGVAAGSFQAPDHEYPSYLELRLTATDAGGASSQTSLRLDPQTTDVNFTSSPSGMLLSVGSTSGVTPFTRTMVIGAAESVSALSPQAVGGTTYQFANWSDGGSQTHVFTAPAGAASLAATYTPGGTLPNLTGTVNGSDGRPIAGATVTLTPDGRSTTTDSAGHFTFTGVNAGEYTVTGSLATSQCTAPASVPVTMSGPQTVTVSLLQRADAYGNTCADTLAASYVAAGTVVGLGGDDAITQISTPFPVKLYGTSYSSAWLDTNGVISFVNPGHSAVTWNSHIPSAGSPHASVFPLWDDLLVDASASIRTASTGTAPNRTFVVEWRNVTFYSDQASRVTVEAIFAETTGAITLVYQGIDNRAEELGATAVIGIENAAGTDGFEYAFHQPLLKTNLSVTFQPPGAGQPPPTGSVSGRVTRASDGSAVAGATMTLNPAGSTTTTAADGSYQFTGVAYGSYTVSVSTAASQCGGLSASAPVTVAGAQTVNLSVTQRSDIFGYTCSTGASAYVAAGTVLSLSGDDNVASVSTPFPIRYYGSTYNTAWVDTNGLVSLVNPGGSAVAFGTHIPTASPPNATVFAFWDDLVVDASASVRTATTGTAPNRQFVVEWRNLRTYSDANTRLTAEVIFSENTGDITLTYANLTANARGQGSEAVVGIESPTGTDGFEYAYQQAVLSASEGVTFHMPGSTPVQTGSISGHVTLPSGGGPAGSVPVTLSPGGLSTTSAADGSYQFATVTYGSYTVSAGAGSTQCGGQSASAPVTVDGNETVDLTLTQTSRTDSYGYTCTDGPATYVAAPTVLALTGDDAIKQITVPFAVTLYGTSYTTAWVDTNGVVSFASPGGSAVAWDTHIPGTAKPNAALYPFWDDLVIDSSASIRTGTTGTAPNRQFIIEWRNAAIFSDRSTRVTFELILTENSGTIAVVYTNMSGTNMGHGSTAVIGIENAAGTVAFEYSYHQAIITSGRGVTFRPPS